MLKVAAYKGSAWTSKLIEWHTQGCYSHVALYDGKQVLEAWSPQGVQEIPFDTTHNHGQIVDIFAIVGLTEEQEASILKFAQAQIGKKYDYPSIFNFILNFRDPDKVQASRKDDKVWFCSELVFAAIQKAGIKIFNDTPPWMISPNWLMRSNVFKFENQINFKALEAVAKVSQ